MCDEKNLATVKLAFEMFIELKKNVTNIKANIVMFSKLLKHWKLQTQVVQTRDKNCDLLWFLNVIE